MSDGGMGCKLPGGLTFRNRLESYKDVRTVNVKNILSRYCQKLSLKQKFIKEAQNLYTSISKKKENFKGYSLECVAASIIFMASQLVSFEMTLEQIS